MACISSSFSACVISLQRILPIASCLCPRRQLLTRVEDLMHTRSENRFSQSAGGLNEVLFTMTNGRLGTTVVVDDKDSSGVFNDGDLRRVLEKGIDLATPMREIMTTTASCQ